MSLSYDLSFKQVVYFVDIKTWEKFAQALMKLGIRARVHNEVTSHIIRVRCFRGPIKYKYAIYYKFLSLER